LKNYSEVTNILRHDSLQISTTVYQLLLVRSISVNSGRATGRQMYVGYLTMETVINVWILFLCSEAPATSAFRRAILYIF